MLEKIKEFFKNIFKINKQKYIEAPKEEIEQIQEQHDFKNQIVIENVGEEERGLKLQRDFKAGLIDEEDLSVEEFNILSDLYERQIERTKVSIESYKDKIMRIKARLVN